MNKDLKYTELKDNGDGDGQNIFSTQPGVYSAYEVRFSRCRTRRTNKRAIDKNGEINVKKGHLKSSGCHMNFNFFRSLVEARWRWTLIVSFLINLVILFLFAGVWWFICYNHGDFEPQNMPDLQEASGWVPCVTYIYSFTSCFLFSIEIQTTIGYGTRHSNESCPETIVVMIIQNLTGVLLSSFAVGIVFAKLMRPKYRLNTIMFSKNAVIVQRNRHLCLLFRVGNLRRARIIDPRLAAFLLHTRKTDEGEILEHEQVELDIKVDECDAEDPFFIWPMTVVHVINSDSPFYEMSATQLMMAKIEIIVLLDGLIESTGQDVQALWSYTPNEILWGHRFVEMVSYNKKHRGYEVDYAKFHETVKINTPLCSAVQLNELNFAIFI